MLLRVFTAVCAFVCVAMLTAVIAQSDPTLQVTTLADQVEKQIVEMKKEDKSNDPELRTRLEILRTQLDQAIQEVDTNSLDDAKKQSLKRGKAVLHEADKYLKSTETSKIADAIGSAKPMTAVLFAWQDRNDYEVVKDPASTDPTIGLINQDQSGTTAGVLVAAEAPFAFPRFRDKKPFTIPIGAWFGVNLTTGDGSDVSQVDLAAGFSASFISAAQSTKIQQGEGPALSSSARLLVGVVYGEVVTLGPANGGGNLEVGDPYPLGEAIPLQKERALDLAIGIGFRF